MLLLVVVSHVCLFVCLFVCLLLFVCLFVCLFVSTESARVTPTPFLTPHKPWKITLLTQGHSSHDEHLWVKTVQATLFVTTKGCTQEVSKCARATDS